MYQHSIVLAMVLTLSHLSQSLSLSSMELATMFHRLRNSNPGVSLCVTVSDKIFIDFVIFFINYLFYV